MIQTYDHSRAAPLTAILRCRPAETRSTRQNKVNQTSFKATRAKVAEHPIEQVGAKLREMMPWIRKNKLVDQSKN